MRKIFLIPTESGGCELLAIFRSEKSGARSIPEDLYWVREKGVSSPSPLLTPDPEYSEAARQAGFRGQVRVSLVVDKDGNPRNIQVLDPAGLGLDEASVNAIQRWKFQPGQKEGRPVNVETQVEAGFGFIRRGSARGSDKQRGYLDEA
jgi:TonB family protein